MGAVCARVNATQSHKETHKAVCVQGPRAASGAFAVAALAGAPPEASEVTLRSAHGLRHWKRPQGSFHF